MHQAPLWRLTRRTLIGGSRPGSRPRNDTAAGGAAGGTNYDGYGHYYETCSCTGPEEPLAAAEQTVAGSRRQAPMD